MNSQISFGQTSVKQWVAGFAAASIFFQLSIDIPWIFGPLDAIPNNLNTVRNIGLVIIGAIIGAISADTFGRKRTLLAALIFVILRLISIIFDSAEWVWIIEIFIEIGSGITCVVVPLYISEIASTNNRGKLMVLQLLVYSIGQFATMALVIIYQYNDFSDNILTIVSGVFLAISVIFHGITLAIFPETPNYLNSKKRYQEAAESLAFFRGINHVTIPDGAMELTANAHAIQQRRPGCCGKICEIMRFENRRSLAIIFSLIVIRWVSGQHYNHLLLNSWANNYDEDYRMYTVLGTYAIILTFTVVIFFSIGPLRRKIFLVLVIFGCFIAAIVGIPILKYYRSMGSIVLFIQHFGHLVLVGSTLAYAGEFFPINVRAFAIVVVISFEILIRNAVIATSNLLSPSSHIYSCGGVFFMGFIFVLVFFPKTNKLPSFEIGVETSPGGQ